ncbi:MULTISPECIES: hypothetical protein [Paenibacillus]|jgi:hypothetical protein|uniref:Spore coat protein D n=1 Tax=Paenibacillus oceani TaxID=2772510 RepID=A0A927CAH5_9BACL|nr:hypothetical protein [Paenibacillus oceani]MBD2862701.1 hypothetical protein [Paenibacillus oceani]
MSSQGFHCPTKAIYDPPRVVYRNHYHPQIVQVVHAVEVVNRHHCVPVYQHVYTCSERDEFCGEMANVNMARNTRYGGRR